MIVVKVGNSVCKVSGASRTHFDELRLATMYLERTERWISQLIKDKNGKPIPDLDPKTRRQLRDKKTGKPKFKTKQVPEIKKHFLMDQYGNFPTGLLYIVEDYLTQKKIPFGYQDTRVVPEIPHPAWEGIVTERPYESYPEQVEAADTAYEFGRGIVAAPTGVGKSTIAAEIIDRFRLVTLIVVPSLELKRQLTEGLKTYFGDDSVGPLVNGRPAYRISVENVDALDPKKVIDGIDLVIVDEFHHSGAATYQDLNRTAWANVYFKIGMTATPFRSKSNERLLLESVLSHVIYRIEYEVAVRKGYIVPMEAYYVELAAMKLSKLTGNFRAVYRELVVERQDRNAIIARMAANLALAGISALVLVKQIDHGLLIQEAVATLGVDIPFVKGENDDNRAVIGAFNRREIDVLIGTTGILGEGVDTKPCEYVILAGLGRSKNAFMQQCGRSFRKFQGKQSCKVIIFRDRSHAWMENHFQAQCEYLLEEYGIVPEVLEI